MEVKPITTPSVWEAFVMKHSGQALFQSWSWGNVQEALGKHVWRLGIYTGNRLVATAQVVEVVARSGSYLHVRHGPIFVFLTRAYWLVWLKYWRNLAKQTRAQFIRVSPLIEPSAQNEKLLGQLGFVSAAIHAMDAERCWVLDLTQSEEELFAGMRKTTRYEIRQSQRAEVIVVKSVNPQNLATFLQLYQVTSQRHGFVPHEGIRQEFAEYVRSNQALLFLAYWRKQPLAGALILFYGGQAIYHHGASVTASVSASHLLQWEAIREAKNRGMKVYNFWGIAPEDKLNHPWRGITVFKKGFGGREINYLHAHDYPTSSWYFIPRSLEVTRRMARGY